MIIELTPHTITTAAAVLAAILAIGGLIFKTYDWVKKQSAQEEEMKNIREQHNADMASTKEELSIIVYGLLACLKGLSEQGCNGPVTAAIARLEEHMNKEAHK